MTETRSKAQHKDVTMREVDEAIGSRMESLKEGFERNMADMIDKNNEKLAILMAGNKEDMEKKLAELCDALRVGTINRGVQFLPEETSTSRSQPILPKPPNQIPILAKPMVQNRDQVRGNEDTPFDYSGLTRLSKLDFPRFNGENIQEWLFKVEQFFAIDMTPPHLRVSISSIHFDGIAATWHQSLMQTDALLVNDWIKYKRLLLERFAEIMDDPIAELKQLQETEGIADYHAKFEVIKTRVNLPEEYLVSAYLAGLRTDTQMHVRMFQPQSIRHCLVLGRLYEKAHPLKPATSNWQRSYRESISDKKINELQVSKEVLRDVKSQTRKRLPPEEINRRRSLGLCFLCDEKYSPEHYLKHKNAQLYYLQIEAENEQESEPEVQSVVEEDAAHISVNAISGVSDCNTMRIKGMQGKQELYILVDSGSTHNFLDAKMAEKLRCSCKSAGLIRVKVADGRHVEVNARVEGFEWQFQNVGFQADMMVIPLGGCDMVLGCQWLQTLGPITWDFKELQMKFSIGQLQVILRGLQNDCYKLVKATKIDKLREGDVQLSMIRLTGTTSQNAPSCLQITEGNESEPREIKYLLTDFQDIFAEPVTLPPFRGLHDHKIPLLEGSNPVNQRPYRYSTQQKDEIDKIVKDMLKTGIVQHSSSSFGSPVVLVKKKDGSWRLCVDYRGLNTLTVKDRFPIPLIEDLMDELGGSKVYTKIDLRSGYHQVRMHTEDIHKTAFKTHGGHYEYLVMPFGLTNAPATFQGLMNSVFQPFLRKFVLVFFDDILVYSSSLEKHLTHLRTVFETMRKNTLFAKKNKCAFAVKRVEYLGHYIEAEGISTDPNKVKAVWEWPEPKTLKQLRGFLGLAGYYRRFVKNFGTIAYPLTSLTKKDAFTWSDEATGAFEKLKKLLCEAPILALPQFDKQFVVETDASGHGIGAVLMQEGHPLAYISRHLKGKQLQLSIYEKELLAVVFAVQKWRHYLLNDHFIIKTDQRSLQYILGQRLNTPIQQQWLSKLLEFDYEVQYRQGKENFVADALSRVEGSEVLHMAMTVLECDLMKQIQEAYDADNFTKELIAELKQKASARPPFSWNQGILRRNSRIVVPANPSLRIRILDWLHSSPSSGHSGKEVTRQRVKCLFFWKGMTKDIQSYIRQCTVCQTCKYDPSAYPGLLQPLPIPETIWTDISMDFIEGLPSSDGMSIILVVVDRLSKAAHFMALQHPYTTFSVAQIFLSNVYKLHGLPQSIVSDRDAVFLSEFWTEFFKLQGVSLQYSTAYHPQSDGQTEVVNRCLETYLRCMCSGKPHQWSKWLPLAEFWYNTTFHSSIQMTPFEAVYGQPPPQHLPYLPGESKVAVVARSLQERENMLLILKFHLVRAQHRMKQLADKKRSEREFAVGDFVFLKLQPYRQQSVVHRSNQKLAPKYYGPYKVIDRCGKVAYKLQLPEGTKIHPVFHVSQLKLSVGTKQVLVQLPSMMPDVLEKEPEAILERKMMQRQGKAATMVLVKWVNLPETEATWEWLYNIQRQFPAFQP